MSFNEELLETFKPYLKAFSDAAKNDRDIAQLQTDPEFNSIRNYFKNTHKLTDSAILDIWYLYSGKE